MEKRMDEEREGGSKNFCSSWKDNYQVQKIEKTKDGMEIESFNLGHLKFRISVDM